MVGYSIASFPWETGWHEVHRRQRRRRNTREVAALRPRPVTDVHRTWGMIAAGIEGAMGK